jgi:hypothetical protein
MDLHDPKLGLFKEVKKLEATLAQQATAGDAKLTLNAFILSATNYDDLINVGDKTKKAELEDKHVLFMSDGFNTYLTKLFNKIQ